MLYTLIISLLCTLGTYSQVQSSVKVISDFLKNADSSTRDEFYTKLIQASESDTLGAFINLADLANINNQLSNQGVDLSSDIAYVPINVKDNINTIFLKTTLGTEALENFVPQVSYNADIVDQLLGDGSVVLGKANLHEFAFGITSFNRYYGACKNPFNSLYSAGGSSGGTAIAVAKGLTHVGIGTDTGGSVRIPASWCGIVGYRPTTSNQARYSGKGIYLITHTFDTAGILGRSVNDVITYDSTLNNYNYQSLVENTKIKISVPDIFRNNIVENIINEAFDNTINVLNGDNNIELLLNDNFNFTSNTNFIDIAFTIVFYEFQREASYYNELYSVVDNDGKLLSTRKIMEISKADSPTGELPKNEPFLKQIFNGEFVSQFPPANPNSNPYHSRQAIREAAIKEYNHHFTKSRNVGGSSSSSSDENTNEDTSIDVIIYPTVGNLPTLIGDEEFNFVRPSLSNPSEDVTYDTFIQSIGNTQITAAIGAPCISIQGCSPNEATEFPIGFDICANVNEDVKLLQIAEYLENVLKENNNCVQKELPQSITEQIINDL